ncbi:ribosomal-processing cysteine protease Prp [Alkalibacterium sp. f15]|uniref:ribosomal-processing cysteine protease Prp n=1 Tax=Alkalibacterium sp. f15 TaxID=3414029 RepID=UPI003BF9194E
MIDIQFRREGSKIMSVEISGHAEAGPYGNDIVCAAVSALSIGTVNSLSEIAEIPVDVVSANDSGGYLKFTLPADLTQKQMETGQILMRSLYLSLKSTEEEYQEYLRINSLDGK